MSVGAGDVCVNTPCSNEKAVEHVSPAITKTDKNKATWHPARLRRFLDPQLGRIGRQMLRVEGTTNRVSPHGVKRLRPLLIA
jgi:hypothetical protein